MQRALLFWLHCLLAVHCMSMLHLQVYILKDSPALAVEVNIAGSESRYRYVKAPKGAPLGDANVKRLLRSYNIPYMEGVHICLY